jgi:hypothetical protein
VNKPSVAATDSYRSADVTNWKLQPLTYPSVLAVPNIFQVVPDIAGNAGCMAGTRTAGMRLGGGGRHPRKRMQLMPGGQPLYSYTLLINRRGSDLGYAFGDLINAAIPTGVLLKTP